MIRRLSPSTRRFKLPDTEIAVVRRTDRSGTGFVWTNYLSKVNADWKSKIGEGSTVNWPTGTGGKGNCGVAAFVQRLPGAIGYIEWADAKQNHMTYVDLKNSTGTVVEPKTETFKAAAASADWSKSFYQILMHGTQAANELDYISLPESVAAEIRTQWKAKVKDPSGKSVAK